MELHDHKVLDFQYIEGTEEAYRSIPNSGVFEGFITTDTTGNTPMRLRYTPPVDAWWEVSATVGIMGHDSVDAWRYMHVGLRLTPFPQYPAGPTVGSTDGWQLAHQLGGGRQFTYRSPSKMFRIHANVTYDCYIRYSGDNSGGLWKHYCGAGYLFMYGTAYEA